MSPKRCNRVAEPLLRDDDLVGLVADGSPDLRHQRVEVPLFDENAGPQLRVKVLLRYRRGMLFNQRFEKRERFWSQGDGRAFARQLSRIAVERAAANVDAHETIVARRAPESRPQRD